MKPTFSSTRSRSSASEKPLTVHLTPGGCHEPCDGAHDGGLAGPVGTDEAVDHPGLDGERDIADRRRVGIVDRQAVHHSAASGSCPPLVEERPQPLDVDGEQGGPSLPPAGDSTGRRPEELGVRERELRKRRHRAVDLVGLRGDESYAPVDETPEGGELFRRGGRGVAQELDVVVHGPVRTQEIAAQAPARRRPEGTPRAAGCSRPRKC